MDSASQEANMKLIKEIGKRPCLYNKTLISYNRKSIHDMAWDEVAKCMGWKASLCKERWRNLRCVYIRHVKKLSQGVHKRPYYLMDAMHFALPFIKSLQDQPSLPTETLEENKDEELEDNYDEDEQQLDVRKSFEGSSPTQFHLSSESPEPRQPFVTAFLPSPSSQMKNEDMRQSSDLSRSRHEDTNSLKGILKTVGSNEVHLEISDMMTPNLELQNDAKKMFLLSLLPDVYAMSDVQMRTFKRKVLNIIGNIFDSENSSR